MAILNTNSASSSGAQKQVLQVARAILQSINSQTCCNAPGRKARDDSREKKGAFGAIYCCSIVEWFDSIKTKAFTFLGTACAKIGLEGYGHYRKVTRGRGRI